MKVDVYDTYAQSNDGRTIHFDVLVETGTAANVAHKHAQDWLTGVGQNGARLAQDRCRFCHVENASPAVKKEIQEKGFFILKMEGCEGL